jgi:anti-sigma regulatory factor (Ser/Thr protein kinase)
MHIEFEPQVERIGEIRHAVRDELGSRCSDDQGARIELVLSELLTNAVAAAPLDSVVSVDVTHDDGRTVICVRNTSAPRNPPVPDPPSAVDPNATRGRGLLIAEALTTTLDIDERGHVVTVTAVFES